MVTLKRDVGPHLIRWLIAEFEKFDYEPAITHPTIDRSLSLSLSLSLSDTPASPAPIDFSAPSPLPHPKYTPNRVPCRVLPAGPVTAQFAS